jgi:hypothetical protein
VNDKLKNFKNRAKNTIKEYAPELITFGAAAATLVAVAAYIQNSAKNIDSESVDNDVEILESNGDGFAVVSSLEALLMMEGNSKLEYKLGDDTYSFVRNETSTEV